jgi:hypothetical protein
MEARRVNEQTRIPGPLLIALHLVPGLTYAGCFFVLSRMFTRSGLAGYLAALVAIPLCLVPVEIGVPLLWSAPVAGNGSLSAATGYRQRGTVVDYVVLPILLFLWWGIWSIVIAPISAYLESHLSGWLPAWATLQALITGLAHSSPAQRSIALGLGIVLSGFGIGYRGVLLPRLSSSQNGALGMAGSCRQLAPICCGSLLLSGECAGCLCRVSANFACGYGQK